MSNGYAGGAPPFDAPGGEANRSSFQLKIETKLTDPVPSGESLTDTVKRVTDGLERRSYVQILP
jgi:hypothetical protein